MAWRWRCNQNDSGHNDPFFQLTSNHHLVLVVVIVIVIIIPMGDTVRREELKIVKRFIRKVETDLDHAEESKDTKMLLVACKTLNVLMSRKLNLMEG